jgi:hypothetical protein
MTTTDQLIIHNGDIYLPPREEAPNITFDVTLDELWTRVKNADGELFEEYTKTGRAKLNDVLDDFYEGVYGK